ncbi:response regulator [Chryseolinea sp. H1M3-3]|uniref:response regulator n=1 Tax=Chryseolinea sp. H1M3-3 TaxID=3034144 RepID=UPI0023ED9C9E|nr:response regulator [Chryseolinea sp. H1M3-3]
MNKVLLVEDTPSLATEIMDILRMEDFDVSLAINGLDALNKLRIQLSDIVISDLFMPEIDGFQLITELKNDDKLKHIPIIILSARTTSDTIEKVKELGADLFLQKPCDSRHLVGSIKKVLIKKERVNTND